MLVIGLVDQLVDNPHIWCILIGLFMRLITPQPPVVNNRSGYGAGGYRAFIFLLIIGLSCLVICWTVIGLGKIIQNKNGQDSNGLDSGSSENYYQGGGILSMMRYARSLPQH